MCHFERCGVAYLANVFSVALFLKDTFVPTNLRLTTYQDGYK